MADGSLIKGRDYYIEPGGHWVFTAEFLRRRGYCCGNGCRHCPYPDDTVPPAASGGVKTRVDSTDTDIDEKSNP